MIQNVVNYAIEEKIEICRICIEVEKLRIILNDPLTMTV